MDGGAAGAGPPAESVEPDEVVVGADTNVTGALVAGSTITTRRVIRRITTHGRLDDWLSDALVGWSGMGAAPNTPTPVRNVASPVTQASARTRPGLHRFARGARSVMARPVLVALILVVAALVIELLGLVGLLELPELGLAVIRPAGRG